MVLGRLNELKSPVDLLSDADLLAFAAVPASARFTGRLHFYCDGERVGPVPFVAICKPHDEPGRFNPTASNCLRDLLYNLARRVRRRRVSGLGFSLHEDPH
jgi:hypothetical protein